VQLPSTQQVAHQDFRNRFKIVKVETTEPLKRGRWTCFDFVDKPAAKEKAAAATVEAGDKKAAAAGIGTTTVPAATVNVAATKIVTSRPASSMARELGALHETTAAAADETRNVDAGTTVSTQQASHQRQPVAGNVPLSTVGGGGANLNSSGVGGVGFAAGPPLMTTGGAAVQQLQQQQQQQSHVSPPVVTSLPQVEYRYRYY